MLSSIASGIRVLRLHFSDRSKSQDQDFSIASVCVCVFFALVSAIHMSSFAMFSNFDRTIFRIETSRETHRSSHCYCFNSDLSDFDHTWGRETQIRDQDGGTQPTRVLRIYHYKGNRYMVVLIRGPKKAVALSWVVSRAFQIGVKEISCESWLAFPCGFLPCAKKSCIFCRKVHVAARRCIFSQERAFFCRNMYFSSRKKLPARKPIFLQCALGLAS